MASELEQYDKPIIKALRTMAQEGCPPSAIMKELKRRLGPGPHLLTLLDYFRQAFCLTLPEAKPIASLSRNNLRDIEDEPLFDELLIPAIQAHRSERVERAS